MGLLVLFIATVAKGVEIESKVNIFKIGVVLRRRGEKTKVTQTYHKRRSGGGGPKPSKAMGDFFF